MNNNFKSVVGFDAGDLTRSAMIRVEDLRSLNLFRIDGMHL